MNIVVGMYLFAVATFIVGVVYGDFTADKK
jgi:hypothetical protein